MEVRKAQVIARILQLLEQVSGSWPKLTALRSGEFGEGNFSFRVGQTRFSVDMRPSGATAAIAAAIARLEIIKNNTRKSVELIPIVAVPYMGAVGKLLCEKAGVNWIDLSGNAHLVAQGVRIHIEGHANQYKQAGRPSDVFAPKSARITRYLLTHWHSAFSLRTLAAKTEMDPGFTSRIVRTLESQGFILRAEAKDVSRGRDLIRVRDPGLLLDAWRARYEFFRHHVIQGHVAARTGEDLLREVADKLTSRGIEYAATGLGAAWLRTHFAGFRLATFYLGEPAADVLLQELGFREDPKGANLWLAIPNDDGVFEGANTLEDIQCVHPIQLYVDLKDQPERSAEAAENLRSSLFGVAEHG
ncbi:MAG TPA: type IV toxin-antitoxin system AbiEi family antitoxin [Candidatus Binataceae bacterium]|nr:type IV toxin-antitoxin system AbiEi family antitoxin [Candidatus Binataceae bacterium]